MQQGRERARETRELVSRVETEVKRHDQDGTTNMKYAKHNRARFQGKSWKDPETLGLNVCLILLYVIGLTTFHRVTGLLDSSSVPPPPESA